MSKIAQYLNEHILGEITSAKSVRNRFSRDGSILSITPELVMFPRVTNDIRKAARFSWQLAEKGHTLPITMRGGGSDQTGAAIGKGIVINSTAHLNNIIHIALKDKDHLVHVQPGVNFKALNDALLWHGLYLPTYPESAAYSTVGGAVANNAGGEQSGQHGMTGSWVTRLEVVLANGDLIETKRINKRELSKKQGLQTFEGELYRKIDGLIEDNFDLINDKIQDERDNVGYPGIADVKKPDGSFDLTPLLIGSQGTLGIISEIVLRTEYQNKTQSIMVAVLPHIEAARDVADSLSGTQPNMLEIYDGALFDEVTKSGKQYPFMEASTDVIAIGAVIYISYNDFSDHARAHKLKRAAKLLEKANATMVVTTDDHSIDELVAAREVYASLLIPETAGVSLPPLVDGAAIASDRHEDFMVGLAELASKHHVELPTKTRWLDGTIYVRPNLQLERVSDKQKAFKLIADYAALVEKHGGTFVAESAEGRLKSHAAYGLVDKDIQHVYEDVKAAFDPFGILNPGVKQSVDVTDLVAMLRPSYDLSDFSEYSPHI